MKKEIISSPRIRIQ